MIRAERRWDREKREILDVWLDEDLYLIVLFRLRTQPGAGRIGIVSFIKFYVLGVQLCFRRFPIDGFSGKWWSK